MPRGTVKWFDERQGFGFIQPEAGGPDVFVHHSVLGQTSGGLLAEGQVVQYETESSPKGPRAVSVRPVDL
jgi:CspA family cold shock protein